MLISSRTPEGEPTSCPICHAAVCIEPSRPPGDAPCPHCGHLLWFQKAPAGWRLLDYEVVAPIREAILRILSTRVAVPALAGAIAVDSLEIVEVVMELEEEFDIRIPDDEAENIKTIEEAIDYIERRLRERE